jgi:peroxiredoxin/mono/diheme cytochrome c family protein
MRYSGALALGLVALSALVAGADTGRPVDFRLQDFRGAWHPLDEARESKLVVIAFLGTECPLASQYAPRLADLARSYGHKGVVFYGVDANQQDAPSALARFAREHDLPFPFLKDVGNELADRLQVERTPEAFVLDTERQVRYRGRVDDQFGFGVHRPAPTRRDLAEALDALLAGRPVATSRTEPAGCRIGRVSKTQQAGGVTYAKHVARILRDRCVACHREGEIAPFSLNSYKRAAGWAETIDEVVQEGRMPPWHASPEFGSFANEARLTDAEKQTIAAWVAAGARRPPRPARAGTLRRRLAHPRPRPRLPTPSHRQGPGRRHHALPDVRH